MVVVTEVAGVKPNRGTVSSTRDMSWAEFGCSKLRVRVRVGANPNPTP